MAELREVFTVRNLARDPESRTARKLRPGNYTGFVLPDGRRVRRAGPRGAEFSFEDVYKYKDIFLEGIKLKEIEVSFGGEVATPKLFEGWVKSYEASKRREEYEPEPSLQGPPDPPPVQEPAAEPTPETPAALKPEVVTKPEIPAVEPVVAAPQPPAPAPVPATPAPTEHKKPLVQVQRGGRR